MLKKEEAAVQENSSSSTGPGTAVIEEILTEIMKGAPSAKENAPGAQRPPPPDRRLGVPPSFVEQPQLIPEDGRQHAW